MTSKHTTGDMKKTELDKFRRYIVEQLKKAGSYEEEKYLKSVLFDIDTFTATL